MVCAERRVGRLDDGELEPESFGVVEGKAAFRAVGLNALCGEPVLPEVQGVVGGDAEGDRMSHPGARAPASGTGALEERHLRTRTARSVAVEDVSDIRLILIRHVLNVVEAKNLRVEIPIVRRVARDAGQVVDTC